MNGPALGPRFQVSAVLGTGSFGTVYAARDLTNDTRVALKLLHQSSAESLYRFKREFRSLRDLQHPNLVRYGELLEHGRRWFFTMELIEGTPLIEYVRSGHTRALDVARLTSCMRQLADGLLALHAQGLVHRDIKPSNILVDQHGRLVLLDFGLVADAREGLGATNNVVGTVAYMSPEQSAGVQLTAASDWYSAGCMFYEALTDQLPFDGSPLKVLMQKQRTLPPSPQQLGMLVPEELSSLCMSLLATDPRGRAGARDVLTALGAVPHSAEGLSEPPTLRHAPFVGRVAELTLLDSALEQAVSGQSVGVAVLGESGMGKTVLVMQAVDRFCARHPEAVVLFGRCYERESVPYNAFDGVIDELTRYLRELSSDRQAVLAPRHKGILSQVFPVLERVPAFASYGAVDSEDPQALRRIAFRALRELFQRISDEVPLAIVIDDMQWADQESLALLEELVRAPDAPRVLLAFTLRPLEQCPAPVRSGLDQIFAQLDKAQRLSLTGLLPEDAVTLARHLSQSVGDSTVSTDLRAMIEDAHGHPLFIDTLVRSRGIAKQGLGDEISVEQALRYVVKALDESARAVLELLCVAAAGTDLPVLSRAAQITPGACGLILSALENRKLVRAARDEAMQEMEPFHDRVRAAVVSVMQPAKIEHCHVKLAEALVSLSRSAPERIAWHYRAAGHADRAYKYVLEAAERATSTLAFDRAAQLYAEALALAPKPDAALMQARAEALANAGKSAEAGEAFRTAAGLADSVVDGVDEGAVGREGRELRLELLRRAADQFLRVGRLSEGLEAAAEALAGIDVKLGLSPRAAFFSLVLERSRLSMRGLSFATRKASEQSAKDLKRVDMLWSLGVTLSTMDHVRSTALLARGLREALNAGEEHRISRALATEAISLAAIDAPPFKRTSQLLAVSGRVAEQRGDTYTRAFHALCSAGVALAARDQFSECVEQASRAQQLFREECRGVDWEIGQASLFELAARTFLGQFRELSARTQTSMRAARECGDKLSERSVASTAAVWALLAEDRPGAAKALLQEQLPDTGKGPILVQDMYRILSDGVVGLYARDRQTLSMLDSLRPALSRSMLLKVRLFRVQFLAWHGRAALLATRDATADERPRLLKIADKDARALDACKTPQGEGHALLIRAAIERRFGHPEAELSMLRRAHDIWSERHCQPFAAAAALRMAKLIGGDEGDAIEEGAATFFRTQGVVNPKRLCGVFLP